MKTRFNSFLLFLGLTLSQTSWAVDSYRFAHVTIETPWMIFIFLLLVLFLPFILMAVLSWYFAAKKGTGDDQ